jgi:3-oxoacyl-[acyl-carrier protein] reductase
LNLKGAVALVTGGAKGLGLSISQHLSSCGAKVCVADIDATALEELPADLSAYITDVTDEDAIKKLVDTIIEEHGSIDVLVNNAGVIYSEPFVNIMKPDSMMHSYINFKKYMTVNLDSVFIVTSAVVEKMISKRTKGAIINISSICSCGNEGQTAYSAAKAAVNAMTVTWSKELGRFGIRCNAVSPGFINTDSTGNALNDSIIKHITSNTPLRRLGEAEDIANAVACVAENDFINGAVLDVNGGLSL